MKLSQFNVRKVPFYPAILLEGVFPRRGRLFAVILSQYLFLFCLIGLYLFSFYSSIVFLLIFLLFVTASLLEAFFLSYYGRGAVAEEIDAGIIIFGAKKNGDLVESFFSSPFGGMVTRRLGLSPADVTNFLSARRQMSLPDYELPEFDNDDFFTTKSLVTALFRQDKKFAEFLFNYGIDEKGVAAVVDWVIVDEKFLINKTRWWSRDNLSEIKAIGKDYAFGRTSFLDRFSRDLSRDPALFADSAEMSHRDDIVSKIEIAFSKSKNANVIVVGEPGAGVFNIVLDFTRKIVSGRVVSSVAYSRVIDLDWNMLVSDSKEKGEFENNLLRCLNEALAAGNIVLVVQNLPAFMVSAESLGSGIASLLGPYLEKNVQIITTADPASFHQKLESDSALTQYFEKILVNEPAESKIFEIVENFLRELEVRHKVFFTYQGLSEVIRSASYYITSGVMPSKAVNLILELAASADRDGIKIIGKKEVLDYVRSKTNIPVGDIRAHEKEKLLNLEAELHKRVVGQDEAINAISNALRRSRAGVRDPKKPIGSFLFLGPTGVGKTETAKALAQIFYGDEKYMMRLDMSEYQSADSLNRLIGSFHENRTGVLSNMLRETPYGVLLLDEFEKADRDVLNLFLQILDEGFFSDMAGKRVSTQNVIFIATSNAASQMIFDITEKGGDPAAKKADIINKIVSDGIYKPELINRFDDAIIFHPLNKDELRQIARLMLKKLAKRLQEKGIELVINQILLDRVVEAGYNRMFGARPMNRAIQEDIEEPIARKIISGELAAGGKMEFTF